MKRRHFLYAMIATITPPAVWAAEDPRAKFFRALSAVESGHDDNAVGDGGASIGRYQIQRAYWIDATEFDKSIGGRYEDVRRKAYAEQVMQAYWQRYAREAYRTNNWEVLARIHNGGPRGHQKKATLPYWAKVKREMGQ